MVIHALPWESLEWVYKSILHPYIYIYILTCGFKSYEHIVTHLCMYIYIHTHYISMKKNSLFPSPTSTESDHGNLSQWRPIQWCTFKLSSRCWQGINGKLAERMVMVATAPQGGEKQWPDMETLLGIRNHRVNGFTRTEPFFGDSQHIGSGVSHPSRAIVPYYTIL